MAAPNPSPTGAVGFRALLGSSLSSAVGGAVSSVAVNWLVYHYTGSTLDVAYVGLTGIVPGIVLGLFAGVLADRYDRRRIMITSDVVRMTVMAVLAIALALTGFSLLLILAAMTLVFSFSAVFTPASQAILPRIVPVEGLEKANGILSALTQTGYTVGAGAGGVVIVFFGAVDGLAVNAATFALSAVFLFQIAAEYGRPRPATPGAKRSFRQDLGEGIQYMRDHRPILQVTLGFLPGNFLFSMVAGFFVVYGATVYGANPAAYGYLVAAMAGGAVLGALAVPRLRARRFAGLLMGASVVGQSGAIALLAVTRVLPLSIVGAAGMGVAIGLINTVFFATMQAIVPNEILARVLSIDSVGSFVAIPAGLLVGGVLAAGHGILFVYDIAAIGMFINGLALLALPGVRSIGYGT
ncbi:MAG: MFS transporter [Thermoplasmata archaeon]|nr:MFS transporter [Thermoplasmata archaeon]MCI4362149.1 MFS transporter [Thermoplasmata archaeon]